MPSKKACPAVLVRGLGPSTTDAFLRETASSFVAIQRAFIVRDPATRASRGFGFIQVAFEDDAQLLVDKMHGTELDGHVISAVIAKDMNERKREAAAAKAKDAPAAKPSAKTHKPADTATPASGAGEAVQEEKLEAQPAAEPAAGFKRKRAASVEAAPAPAPTPAPAPVRAAAEPESESESEAEAEAEPVAETEARDASDSESEAEAVGGKTASAAGGPKAMTSSFAGAKPSFTPTPHAPCGVSLGEQQCHIALFGLPDDFAQKRLWKRVRKLAATGCHFPFTLHGGQHVKCAILDFDRKISRDRAFAKLDKHILQGHAITAILGENILPPRKANTAARVIVRNLAFNVTPAEVHTAFLRHGVPDLVTHVHIPQKPAVGDQPARGRGFAFVEFATRDAAAAAIAQANEKKIAKRVVAIDWAVSKDEFNAPATAPAADAPAPAPTPAPAAEEGDMDTATDDAAPADADADEDAEEEEEEAAPAEDDVEDAEGDDGVVDGDAGSYVGSDDGKDEVAEDDEEGDGEPVYRAAGVEAGTTLFIRNVLFETTDEDLFHAFKAFGPVRYARVVKDRELNRSKGTAFVQFYTKEGADRALEAGGSSDMHSTIHSAGDANSDNPRDRKRALAALAVSNAMSEGGIRVGGRTLLVSRAVNKEEAAVLATGPSTAAGGGSTKKYEKRHLYLATEGNIRPDSDAAGEMPKSDLAKRESAQKEKKSKLKSPMFFVSPTRLSVRNMSKSVDDVTLRKIAREAAIAGLAENLVRPDEGDPRLRLPRSSDGSSKSAPVKVLKAKVIRESTPSSATAAKTAKVRFEADGVTPLSKGYGFVEFAHHMHALAALRKLNNNPEYTRYSVSGPAALSKPKAERPRLIVEFTVENWQEVKKQERKKELREARKTLGGERTPAPGGAHARDHTDARTTAKPPAKRARTEEADTDVGKPRGGGTGGKPSARGDARPPRGAPAATTATGAGRQDKSVRFTDASPSRARDAPAARKPVRGTPAKPPRGDEFAHILSGSEADGSVGAAQKQRRAAKKSVVAEDKKHDDLVDAYVKKFFGGAGKAGAASGSAPAAGVSMLSKWM